MKTEYDFGWAYAEWMVEIGEVEMGSAVNIEAMLMAISSIPDGDHREMVDAGIANPAPRAYWQGYNDYMTA